MDVQPMKALTLLPPRIALGATMLYHGADKLRGEGPQKTAEMMESMGFKPGKRWAWALGLTEFIAGAASILGIATRPAALGVLITQGVAVKKVHAKNGFSIMKGGFEFNLALMGIAAALLFEGAGPVSTKRALSKTKRMKKLARRVEKNRALRFAGAFA